MESFVIRIYRRLEAGQPAVVGTLESIATGKRSVFHSQAELLANLDADISGVTVAQKTAKPKAIKLGSAT